VEAILPCSGGAKTTAPAVYARFALRTATPQHGVDRYYEHLGTTSRWIGVVAPTSCLRLVSCGLCHTAGMEPYLLTQLRSKEAVDKAIRNTEDKVCCLRWVLLLTALHNAGAACAGGGATLWRWLR